MAKEKTFKQMLEHFLEVLEVENAKNKVQSRGKPFAVQACEPL